MRPDPEVQRIAEAVRRELEAIYAELRLSQTQRAALIVTCWRTATG